MGGNKIRDVILLGVVVALALLILLPDREPDTDNPEKATTDQSSGLFKSGTGPQKKNAQPDLTAPVDRGADSGGDGIPHLYLPLSPGNTWIYKVLGPERFVPDEKWTLKIVTKPEGEEPGVAQVGFGEEMAEAKIWLDGESLRFDGLPLMEPMEFLGNRPTNVSGAFLPAAVQVSQDAVWNLDFERDVIYQSRDKQGKSHSMPAKANERARATARGQEVIVTSAGPFNTWKLSWISRVEIFAKGRPVLKELTAEPYRRETMWIAPGVGIVKRAIDYIEYQGPQVVFDLVEFRESARKGPGKQ